MTLGPTDWLILAWLFVLGGTVGSFLNVVVHRLPAGMSLVKPPSHCPACGEPIRWYDNVPVFAWMWLRDRCRDCGARISPRYPMVEALTAGLFVLLGALGPVAGGSNLPARPVEAADGLVFPERSFVELCGICGYHLLLLCTLLCAALIAWDGRRVPGRLFLPALVVGASAPLMWPQLLPVPVTGAWIGWVRGGIQTSIGGLAGGGIGWLASRPLPSGRRAGLWLGMVSAGVYLGWQAGLILGALVGGVSLLGRRARGPRASSSPSSALAWLGAGALAWIVGWSWIDAWLPPPG